MTLTRLIRRHRDPVEPDTRHLADARRLLEAEEQRHRSRRAEVLAAAADDLLQGLADQKRADNAELAMLAPKVRRLMERRNEGLRLVADVLGAVATVAGSPVHPSRAQRVRRDVDVQTLLDAAEADMTLLDREPIPVVPNRQPRIMREDTGWVVRVGEQAAAAAQGVG